MRMAGLAEREPRLPELLAPAAVSAAVITATASASGGFFPPAWGWSAAALLLAAGGALVVADRLELGRLEVVSLASLTASVAWAGLSALWSQSPPRSILESQRGLVYVAALATFLLLCSRRTASALLVGTAAAASGVSIWGLATKLFPNQFRQDVTFANYGLARPLGYWNAVGLVAVVAALLATGLAIAAPRRAARAAGAALVPVLIATLYLTFSRGSWLALGLGLVVLVSVHPARGRAAATIVALAPPAAAAVWLESRSSALTHVGASLSAQVRSGHRVALALVLLAAAAAAAPALVRRVPLRPIPGVARRVLLVLLAFGTVAVAVVMIRSSSLIIGRAYDAFRSSSTPTGTDLNRRLFSAAGNERADYWRVAWDDVRAHPFAGSGAGTFELRWDRERPDTFGARDAHNLYLEMLAEVGPLGLALLLLALGAPLVAAAHGRSATVAPAAAAYCAYLGHAALDWDWEIPTVTLTALGCASVCLASARRQTESRQIPSVARVSAVALALVLAAVAGIGYAQASALNKANDALDAGALQRAATYARRAARLAPWQADPWVLLGEAQLARGERSDARASFRRAVAKDRGDWFPWYELALASRGLERREALAEALRRNPRDPELAALRSALTKLSKPP